nr:transcription activator GLK2-like isoform X3 [Ipomoea trifida]
MAENFFPSSSSSSPSVPPSIEGGQSSSGPENPTGTGFYPQPTPRFKYGLFSVSSWRSAIEFEVKLGKWLHCTPPRS